LNQEIRANLLRVIDEDGKQIGVLSKEEALRLANEKDLDLVEISPEAKPPVVKIVDWGKFNYQKTKSLQKNKKSNKILEIKQIRLGLKISDNDLQIKVKKSLKFLETGHKVKFIIIYKGREQAHKELGFKLAEKIINIFGADVGIDQNPILAGRQLSFVLKNNKKISTNNKESI
jgi:translation initiation factor IF-3